MANQKETSLYIGTYEKQGAPSIYTLSFDEETGAFAEKTANAEIELPSFLIVNAKRDRLYSVVELEDKGRVAAFALDEATGELQLLNEQPTEGGAPCHLTLVHEERVLLVTNYVSGNVAVYPILEDGGIGPLSDLQQHEGRSVTERQEGPHAHCVVAKDGHIYIVDLGIDQIVQYGLDPSGPRLVKKASVTVQAGAGPRHLAFHSSLPFAYVINELNNTIIVFRYEAESGALTPVETVPTLPADFNGVSYCAEIVVHPSGRTLYGSNRGHDSIAVFAIDPDSGRLELQQHISTQGKFPRNFSIAPGGRFLVAGNQNSDSIYSYRIDEENGLLAATGHSIEIPSPACIRF
ncbi:lactonase family protein [Paenibacillus filicis]|uniref:Lactonase family protein n=1 Tax=Paenibacillus filicis TaxID=669464 RepID=A0ABU9DZ58_9BACL